MTCCAPGAESAAEALGDGPENDDAALMGASSRLSEGRYQLELAVPDMHCAACIRTVETGLKALPMVETARVNLSTKRVRVIFDPAKGEPSRLTSAIAKSGYAPLLLDPGMAGGGDKTLKTLTRSLAVAGFAAGNIMLFSVSIWSGADAVTRDMFHWISALIAVPAVAYAGQPFFRSALRALRGGHLNMDVPIALAVLLALGMSIVETIAGSAHAYFDASVTLLFFLLIGRTLDHLMREKARSAVTNLARRAPRAAMLIREDGQHEKIELKEVVPGMKLLVAAGERVPVDGRVVSGRSQIDMALVSGESVPEAAGEGTVLLAGATNLDAPLVIEAERPASESFHARMMALMEAAEGSRAGYRRIADRAASIYAPAVHLLALGTFVGWGLFSGNWHTATINAIAVLIVTCPCALALAVPIVHIVAAGRLFAHGILMRDGAALERMAETDLVFIDKTGTLTQGKPVLTAQSLGGVTELRLAGALAAQSRHPYSRAIAQAAGPVSALEGEVREVPGKGIEAHTPDGMLRLGGAHFCGAAIVEENTSSSGESTVYLSRDGALIAAFSLADEPRPDARAAMAALEETGVPVRLISGDRPGPVAALARRVGITDFTAGMTPADKLALIEKAKAEGMHPLMIGDGINDAPSLAAAHASMAPSSAADIGRNAADFVFTRSGLSVIPFAHDLARRAARTVKQNFGLAIAYNCVAVPLAISGQVTPLIAALAMSSSSMLVTLNAMRLRLGSGPANVPAATDEPQPADAGIRTPVAA
jgi:Cu2+-exporting ATPase